MKRRLGSLRAEQVLLLSFLSISFLLLVLDLVRQPVQGFAGYHWLILGLVLLMVVLGVWTVWGAVKGPATVYLVLVFGALTYVAFQLNGVNSVTVPMYILLILIAVPLLGWIHALVFTLASLAVLWILAFLPISVVLPPQVIQARNLTIVFVGTFVLVWWYGRQLLQTAERLKKANIELEERVNERTRQVLVSEKLATVGRLAATVAHELNTPLGAVVSAGSSAQHIVEHELVGLLQGMSSLPPQQRELLFSILSRLLGDEVGLAHRSRIEEKQFREELILVGTPEELIPGLLGLPKLTDAELTQIVASSQREQLLSLLSTASTLRQALVLVQVGAGKASQVVHSFRSLGRSEDEGEPAPFSPAYEVDTVLALLGSRVTVSLRIERHVDRNVVAMGRADRYSQVVINLVNNGIHAMGGKGTLVITVEGREGFAVTEVSDTGHGIPETIRSRIFEPFFTTKPPGEGNGLGLDVARRLCQADEGSLELLDRPGMTTFRIMTPLAEQ